MAEFNNKDFEKYFEPLLEGARQLNQLLLDNIESLKDFGKVAEQNIKKLDTSKAEDVADLNKQLEILDETTQDLAKTQKDQKKVEQELTKQEKQLQKLTEENAQANKELAVEIEKVRLQRTQARKAAKEEAKEQLGLNDTYAKQRARLNELTKSLINLRLEGKETTETFQEQEEEFKQLFTAITEAEQAAGRFQRQVGDYAKATEDATKATEQLARSARQLKRLGAVLVGVSAGSSVLNRALKSNEETLDEFGAASEAVSSGIDQIFSSALKELSDIKEASDVLDFSFTRISEDVEQTTKALFDLSLQQKALNRQLVNDEGAVLDVAKALNEYIQEVDTGIPKLDEFLKSIGTGFVTATNNANISIQRLAREYAVYDNLVQEADRSTLGLNKRLELSKQAAEAGAEARQTESRQIEAQIRLEEQRVKAFRGLGAREDEARQRLAELQVQQTQLQVQQNAQRIEDEERTAQLRSDIVQIQLDTLIDQFDNIKSVNERIIADDRFTAAERQAVLDETNVAFEKSVAEQIRVTDELLAKNGQRLEQDGEEITLSQALNDIRQLNIDQQDDAVLALGASEEITTRILEILREERTARQDLAEAQRDLNDARREEQELTQDVEAQNEAIQRISELTLKSLKPKGTKY
jgi:hypothetical protein